MHRTIRLIQNMERSTFQKRLPRIALLQFPKLSSELLQIWRSEKMSSAIAPLLCQPRARLKLLLVPGSYFGGGVGFDLEIQAADFAAVGGFNLHTPVTRLVILFHSKAAETLFAAA